MKRTKRYFIVIVAIVAILITSLGTSAQTKYGQIKQPLSVALDTVWQGEIPVCWETPGFQTEKGWVRSAVSRTWEKESAVRFAANWVNCNSKSSGIRIAIKDLKSEDEWQHRPHTIALGAKLDGQQEGMVLNFTFNNWNISCQSNLQSCIESLAVHEFGHALGFAHEQNSPNTPLTITDAAGNITSCRAQANGKYGDFTVGLWDLSSVMNYCNPQWNNGGNLSNTDIEGVRRIYGNPGGWYSTFGKWCSHKTARLYLSDFNGDGITDMLCHDQPDGKRWISYGTGLVSEPFSSDNTKNWHAENNWCGHATGQLLRGDFNGDGRTDLLCHDRQSGHKWIAQADANGYVPDTTWEKPEDKFCSHNTAELYIGDFDGDKRADWLCHDRANGYKWIAFANPDGTFSSRGWDKDMKWCYADTNQLFVGDFNGDGRSDLLCHDVANGYKWVAFADAGGGFSNKGWYGPMNWCYANTNQLHIADVNGDKRDDLVCHDRSNGWKWVAYASNSGTFNNTDWEGLYGKFCSHPAARFLLGKFDRGNMAAFFCHDRETGEKWISFLTKSLIP